MVFGIRIMWVLEEKRGFNCIKEKVGLWRNFLIIRYIKLEVENLVFINIYTKQLFFVINILNNEIDIIINVLYIFKWVLREREIFKILVFVDLKLQQ